MVALEQEIRRDLDAESAALVGDDIIYFPVRHHSPACAWHLRALIRARPPSRILIEGPSDFTESIDLLLDSATRAPVSFYTYAVRKVEKDPANPFSDGTLRASAYYPFCDYSPELVALREGREAGARLEFIDLTFAQQLMLGTADESPEAEHARSLLDERYLARSHALLALARRLHCRDHDELWEHLVEAPHRGASLRQHVERVYAWCRLARVDADPDATELEGTREREREMAFHIAAALDERAHAAETGAAPGPVLVVAGGYHVVALPELVAARPERAPRDEGAIVDRGTALIRYSFDRLERLNGYGAGMRAPAYQQHIWEERSPDPGRSLRAVALGTLLDVAANIRARLGGVPTPDVAAAYEHAIRIAALRDRPGPTREDVLDSVRSCFVRGAIDVEGAPVLEAAQRALVGTGLGSVPAHAGTPPLVADVQRRARRQRLKIDATDERRVRLDIYRRREHRVTSRFMHGLSWLGIPFASMIAGPDFVTGTGLDRLHETWTYAYAPATEAALVEAAVWGPSVPEAVAARFAEALAGLAREGGARDAAMAVRFLVQGCVLGVHDSVPGVIRWLNDALAEDADVASVAGAASQLALLWEAREPLEAREITELPLLLANAFGRGCFLLRALDAPPENATQGIIAALERLRDLAASPRIALPESELFWDALPRLASSGAAPVIAGAATGILHAHGTLDTGEVGARVRGRLAGDPKAGIAFLRGLVRTAREIVWQGDGVLLSLNAVVAGCDDDAFLRLLPELRLTFANLTPPEIDRVAGEVAKLHGAASIGTTVVYGLSESTMLALVARDVAARAALAADGLEEWVT